MKEQLNVLNQKALKNVLHSIFYVDTFLQQCVIIKAMVQSDQLIEHMVTIGIYIYLSDNEFFQHICLQNINKLYKTAGKCNDQQQYKTILSLSLVPVSAPR